MAGAATSLLSMWNSKMNAIAASRHEEFAGRLQSTGNKAELYTSPMDTGSNSRYDNLHLNLVRPAYGNLK